MWALCNCIQQLLSHFEFLVLVIGDPCPLCDPRLYYYQMTEEEMQHMPWLRTIDSLLSGYVI